MKFIFVIAGILAVLAIVQARPQEAENDNQEEAIEVPSEPERESAQEKNDNQIPELPQEKPHGRPHIHHPGQQQPAPPRGSSSGRNPRPHRHSHRHRPQEQRPEPQPEQQPNQDDSVIDEAEPVLGIGLYFNWQ